MSDTPRTDKAEKTCDTLGVMHAFGYAIYHGQKLELELNDANERIKRLENQIEAFGRLFSSKECDSPRFRERDTPQEIIDILNKNFGDLV
jgi:hypothetical protein